MLCGLSSISLQLYFSQVGALSRDLEAARDELQQSAQTEAELQRDLQQCQRCDSHSLYLRVLCSLAMCIGFHGSPYCTTQFKTVMSRSMYMRTQFAILWCR